MMPPTETQLPISLGFMPSTTGLSNITPRPFPVHSCVSPPRSIKPLSNVVTKYQCHLCSTVFPYTGIASPSCPTCAHKGCSLCHSINIEGEYLSSWRSPRIPVMWVCGCDVRRSIYSVLRVSSGTDILEIENELDRKACSCGKEELKIAGLYNLLGRRIAPSPILAGCNLLTEKGFVRAVKTLKLMVAMPVSLVQDEEVKMEAEKSLKELGYVDKGVGELVEWQPMNWSMKADDRRETAITIGKASEIDLTQKVEKRIGSIRHGEMLDISLPQFIVPEPTPKVFRDVDFPQQEDQFVPRKPVPRPTHEWRFRVANA